MSLRRTPSLHESLLKSRHHWRSYSYPCYSIAEKPCLGWGSRDNRFSRFVCIGKVNWTELLVLGLYYIPQVVLSVVVDAGLGLG